MSQTTTEGYWLRVQLTPMNYHFTLPSTGSGSSYSSMDDFFQSIGSTRPNKGGDTEKTEKGTKSTISSGWFDCSLSHKEIGNKCRYADTIYDRADDSNQTQRAAEMVKEYKQHAHNVLQRYYDSNLDPSDQMAQEINEKACLVYEIKVFVMLVTNTPVNGVTPSKKDGLYRVSKCVRKFYTLQRPLQSLLNSFAEVLAETGTNIDYLGRLEFVRSDGVTPRTGRNAGYRHFKIQ